MAVLVDRVSGHTRWVQHGTVLADWQNTRTDSVMLLIVAGQRLLSQVFVSSPLFLSMVRGRRDLRGCMGVILGCYGTTGCRRKLITSFYLLFFSGVWRYIPLEEGVDSVVPFRCLGSPGMRITEPRQ